MQKVLQIAETPGHQHLRRAINQDSEGAVELGRRYFNRDPGEIDRFGGLEYNLADANLVFGPRRGGPHARYGV